jgi:hypothetical protein
VKTVQDYLSLVTNWHSARPRYMQTLATLLRPLADMQVMLRKLLDDTDLDYAVGVQLDIIGQWVGRDRYVQVPISGVFFSFDDATPRTGFDQGIWLGEYDPTDAVTALDDETYRTLLKLQVIANHWDGTLVTIQAAMDAVFPGLVIQDLGDTPGGLMSMDVLIPSNGMSSLMLAVLEQDFPVKPAGVRMNVSETTVGGTPLFGFDLADGVHFGGFDQGSWGKVVFVA